MGWLLYRYSRFKKTGITLKVFSLLLFLAFGYGIGDRYLYSLERRYPPFDPTPDQCEQLRGSVVVVLGQGLPVVSDLPIRCRENSTFMLRLLEGMRVAKLIPDSQLIVSMAGKASEQDKQMFLDDLSAIVLLPTNRTSMITTARDTREEVALAYVAISNRVAGSGQAWPMIIVATSASHIPRAIKIFQKVGVCPIPAPCDYTDFEKQKGPFQWPFIRFPSGYSFDLAERGAHEWLGSLYERLF